jgi:hypothetical protein
VNNPQDPNLKLILDEYRPLSQEIDLEDLRASHDFFIKKFSDALYFGQCTKTDRGKLVR